MAITWKVEDSHLEKIVREIIEIKEVSKGTIVNAKWKTHSGDNVRTNIPNTSIEIYPDPGEIVLEREGMFPFVVYRADSHKFIVGKTIEKEYYVFEIHYKNPHSKKLLLH